MGDAGVQRKEHARPPEGLRSQSADCDPDNIALYRILANQASRKQGIALAGARSSYKRDKRHFCDLHVGGSRLNTP